MISIVTLHFTGLARIRSIDSFPFAVIECAHSLIASAHPPAGHESILTRQPKVACPCGHSDPGSFIACSLARDAFRHTTQLAGKPCGTWLKTPPVELFTRSNFPTYISGHSTQSGAAARVLTDLFGIVTFTD